MRLKKLLDIIVVLALAIGVYNTNSGLGERLENLMASAFVDAAKPMVQFIAEKLVVPTLAGLIILFVWYLYNHWVWRFVARIFYQDGWWIYAVHVESAQTPAAQSKKSSNKKRMEEDQKASPPMPQGTVGLFSLNLGEGNPTIDHADSYYVFKDGTPPDKRGFWRTRNVWLSAETIEVLYQFQYDAGNFREVGQNYYGAVVAERQKIEPIAGKSCWRGKFYRLGNGGTGAVYAEKLGFFCKTQEQAKRKIILHQDEFLERARG